ncbi:MAG: cyclic nucleotide-binding domain-containing protein [Deltaproteobacteria bacterium]|nr:cyclic nucleotide-binding domain-containing protein [Deltaproteobacteria bacterium]
MKVTFSNLKEFTRGHISAGNTREAVRGGIALMKADPLDMEVRFIITDLLISLREKEKLAMFLQASFETARVSGHGACAFSFAGMLRDIGFDVSDMLSLLADTYSSSSNIISDSGSRVAPLEDSTPVDAPESYQNSDDELILSIVSMGSDKSKLTDLPARLLPMPLLSELDRESFLTIIRDFKILRLKESDPVIREGEPGDSFYICALGDLNVFKSDTYGRKTTLATLHGGAIFGEMALVQRAPRSASVNAGSFAEVLEFSARNLSDMASQLPVVAQALDKFTRDRLIGNLMNNSPFFKPFSRKQRKELLKHFQAYVVETDTVVVREGDEGAGLYIVLGGEIDIFKDYKMPDEVRLATLGSTESFGEISLINDSPTSASCVAARRSTLLFLARHYFSRLLSSVPELNEYFKLLSENRLHQTRDILAEIQSEEEEEFILI